MSKLDFCERQTFWMEPDCYDGKACDQMRPQKMYLEDMDNYEITHEEIVEKEVERE